MFKKASIMVAAGALVFGLGLPPFHEVSSGEAEAKGFRSSSSFSRSSFRSSSVRSKPSFSSYSSKKSTSETKYASSKKAKNVKTSKSSKKSFGYSKQSRTASVYKAKNERARFKKPTTVKTRSSAAVNKKYSRNPVYSRARSYDSSTYHDRRGRYYNGYTSPSYVYRSSPSYGMWDTIFLYHMLSHNNSSNFAYNQQNNADYRAWRREADQLAVDNAALRTQLATMDAGATKLRGTPVNESYMPKGIDADIALSQEARVATLPELRVCTGSRSGAYFNVSAGILAPNVSEANITVVETTGTGEILSNIASGKCDAGFVQGDGYWNYIEDHKTTKLPFERVFTPYRESVHLVCNAKGPSKISALTSKNKVWFPAQSGAAETWRNFMGEDEDYAEVQTSITNPKMSVSTNEEALLKVTNDKNSCMMYVGAEGSTRFMRNVDASAKTSNLKLIEINDGALDNTEDPSGNDVYKVSELHTKKYANLLRYGGCYGYCGGDVNTLTVNADFVVSNDWKAKNSKAYPKLALTLMGLQTSITKYLK